MVKSKRVFNGKTYKWYDTYFSASGAEQTAKRIRENGEYARVIESDNGWHIYTR